MNGITLFDGKQPLPVPDGIQQTDADLAMPDWNDYVGKFLNEDRDSWMARARRAHVLVNRIHHEDWNSEFEPEDTRPTRAFAIAQQLAYNSNAAFNAAVDAPATLLADGTKRTVERFMDGTLNLESPRR